MDNLISSKDEITELLQYLEEIRNSVAYSNTEWDINGALFRNSENSDLVFRNGCTTQAASYLSCSTSSYLCCENIYEKKLFTGGLFQGYLAFKQEVEKYLDTIPTDLDPQKHHGYVQKECSK